MRGFRIPPGKGRSDDSAGVALCPEGRGVTDVRCWGKAAAKPPPEPRGSCLARSLHRTRLPAVGRSWWPVLSAKRREVGGAGGLTPPQGDPTVFRSANRLRHSRISCDECGTPVGMRLSSPMRSAKRGFRWRPARRTVPWIQPRHPGWGPAEADRVRAGRPARRGGCAVAACVRPGERSVEFARSC